MNGGGYRPGPFKYNWRAAFALVPALAVTLGFAHQFVAGVGVVGALAATILDLSGAKEATFFGVWITLAVCFAGSTLAMLSGADARARETVASLETLVTLLAEAQLFVLVGCWATIQFKWVQVKHPGATLAMEKMLMTVSPLVSLVLFSQGLMAAVGSGQAPFYALACSLILHLQFLGRPIESSFLSSKGGGGGRQAATKSKYAVVEEGEALTCTLTLLSIPLAFYFFLHLPECWPMASLGDSATHFWSLLLLFSVPLMYLSVGSPKGGKGSKHKGEGMLWWSGLSANGNFVARIGLANVALVAMVLGLEGRVIFQSFQQYIRIPAPWNFIAITLALYGVGAAVVNFVIAADSSKFRENLDVTLSETMEEFAAIPGWVGVVFILSVTAGCVALGMSTLALVAALTSAAGLVLFIESRLFRDYLLFVAGVAGTLAWFLKENFWYLDVKTGSLHMQTLCVLITAGACLSALLPGLVISGFGGKALLGSVLLSQSLLLTYLERGIAFGARTSRFDEGDFTYPPYLVLCTSGLGVVLARKLAEHGKVSNLLSWLLQCVLGSKISILVLEEANLVVPCVVLSMAATAPTALYKEQGRVRHLNRKRRVRMREWQGVAHAALIVAAVLYARFVVFDVLQVILGRRPSEGLLLGSLLILSSCACVPLVRTHFPLSQGARRTLISALAAGLVIALVRPPLPIAGGARCPRLPFELCPRLWDSDHRPEHEIDDVAIYGDLVARREHWPKWLLVMAVVSGLASMGGRGGSKIARICLALNAGLGIGSYASLELFPGYPFMQFMAGLTTTLCLLVLAMVQGHGGGHPGGHGALGTFVLLVLMLPLSLVFTYVLPPKHIETDDARLYVDVERDRSTDARVSLLMAHTCYMLLVAFTIKLKVKRGAGAVGNRKMGWGWKVPPQTIYGGGSSKGGGGALALMGNIATVETFLLCLLLFKENEVLHSYVIFMLCPILLLLNQDGYLLARMTDQQRYAPVVASIPLVLTSKAFADLLEAYSLYGKTGKHYDFGRRGGGGGGAAGVMSLGAFLLNNLGIFLTLPNHVFFLNYLWGSSKLEGLSSDFLLVIFTPLNLVALLVTSLDSVRVQALCSIVFALIQFFHGRRLQRKGMQLL